MPSPNPDERFSHPPFVAVLICPSLLATGRGSSSRCRLLLNANLYLRVAGAVKQAVPRRWRSCSNQQAPCASTALAAAASCAARSARCCNTASSVCWHTSIACPTRVVTPSASAAGAKSRPSCLQLRSICVAKNRSTGRLLMRLDALTQACTISTCVAAALLVPFANAVTFCFHKPVDPLVLAPSSL